METHLFVPEKHVTFPQPGFFANRDIFTKLTIFGNTKQVIQDYDTVFDNSIPFRKNDPVRITYFKIPILNVDCNRDRDVTVPRH